MIANTIQPPYYAVIFTSIRTSIDEKGYQSTAAMMEKLACQQDGYLGAESARNEIGITVSYWSSPDAILKWKKELAHQAAQTLGKEKWYENYRVRVCKVEREYGLE
jgi:heme-degrading monooxygenase HmoA